MKKDYWFYSRVFRKIMAAAFISVFPSMVVSIWFDSIIFMGIPFGIWIIGMCVLLIGISK